MKKQLTCALALLLAVLMLLPCAPMFAAAAALPTPKNFAVSGGDGAFQFRWDRLGDVEEMPVRGYYVLYSTDQSNWQKAAYAAKGAAATSCEAPEEGTFVPGTTYYFSVCAYDWNNQLGEKSNVVSLAFGDSKGDLKAQWDALVAGYNTKTKEKGTKYDKVNLVKNEKVVFDNGLYTLTAQITDVSATKLKVKLTMKNKTSVDFECSYLDYVASGKAGGKSLSLVSGSKTLTLNRASLADGANYLCFTVGTYGSPISQFRDVVPGSEYNEYHDELLYLNRKHNLYFQNAPQASKLSFAGDDVKVTAKAISFGAAYKSTAKAVKSSGTILYYKASADKSWSKKTFAAGKALALSKLKANTQYQLKTVNFVKSVSAADKKTVVTSSSGYSNTVTLRTGIATAPEIKSIKVTSKVVKIHHDETWTYTGSKLVHTPAYDSTGTDFTVTVTLKSVPKGMVALQCSGLGGIKTKTVKGKNGTYTFTGNRSGNAKGTTVSLSFLSYTNDLGGGWYTGSSPAVKKSVTL